MNLRTIENILQKDKQLNDEQKEYIVKKINTYWNDHPDVANRYPRWRKYIAWVAGYQLFDYNRITKKLVEVPLTRQHKLVFNKLRPYVKTVMAKLTADQPQMSVVPATADDADLRAALVGGKIVEGLAEKIGFIQQLNYIKAWLIICNRAYMQVLWDDKAKSNLGYVNNESDNIVTGEGINSSTGGPNREIPFEMATVEGDVNVKCISPFNCRPDPLYFDREDWRWFVYGQEEDADEIEREYDLDKGTIKEETAKMDEAYTIDTHDEQDILLGRPGQPSKKEDVVGRVTLKKYLWTPKMFAIIAGDTFLEAGKNEWEEIPFFAFEERVIPIETYQREYVYNESVIKDLIPLQREYNRMQSICSIALDRASKMKILTPIGSVLSKRQFVNDYAVFIDVNTRLGKPEQMRLDPFPLEVLRYKDELEKQMESIFSLSPASFGRLPERASHASGTLVNLLIEQDDVVLNPLLNHINDVISDVWSLALKIIQKKYNEERIIKVTGDDGSPNVIRFVGADLRNNTDVKITSQTGLPRSRPLRIEYIMKLREAGLLTDDRATLEILQMGQVEKIFKDELLHEKRALRENSMILDNPMITPLEIQDWVYPLEIDAIHMKIHLRVRLGPEWSRLTENQKQCHDLHIANTQKAMDEKKQAMLQEAIAQAQAVSPMNTRTATPRGAGPGPGMTGAV